MKAKGKLLEGQEDRIKERLQKFKARGGHRYFLTNIAYPESEKRRLKIELEILIADLEKIITSIKSLIKTIKSEYIEQVWDQNAITAVYLLIGKAYGNLETMVYLAREGRNFEIIEIARSAQESLDLALLFQEEGQEEHLNNWFKGKIISNKIAREALHRSINSDQGNPVTLPVYDTKTDVYSLYSEYTHSAYAALLDTVDVFHEDYDFNAISGHYYTHRYFNNIVKNLIISLLLELKNVFLKLKNLPALDEVDNILSKMGSYKASAEELKEIEEMYK